MNSLQKKKQEMAEKFGAKAKIKLPSAKGGFSSAKEFLGGGKRRDDDGDGDASTVVASNTSATRASSNNKNNNKNIPAAVAVDDLKKLGEKAKLKFRSVRGIGGGATAVSSDASTTKNSGMTRAHNNKPSGALLNGSTAVTSNATAARACKEHHDALGLGDVLVKSDGREASTNPFDGDDDEGSDPLAVFSKKKPSPDVESQPRIELVGSPGSGVNKTSNPFRDDDDAEGVGAGGGANPFDHDEPAGGAAARPGPPEKSVPSAAEMKDPRGGPSSGSGADRPDNPYQDEGGARRAIAALATEGGKAPDIHESIVAEETAKDAVKSYPQTPIPEETEVDADEEFEKFLELLKTPDLDDIDNIDNTQAGGGANRDNSNDTNNNNENNDDTYPFMGDVLVKSDGSEASTNPFGDDDDDGSNQSATFSNKKTSESGPSADESKDPRSGPSSGSRVDGRDNPYRDNDGARRAAAALAAEGGKAPGPGSGTNPFDCAAEGPGRAGATGIASARPDFSTTQSKDDDFSLGRKAGTEEKPPLIPKPLLSVTNSGANPCGDILSNEASTNTLAAKEPGDGDPAASKRSEMPPFIQPLLSSAPVRGTPRRPAGKDNVAMAILGLSSVSTTPPISPSRDEYAVKDSVSPSSSPGTSGSAPELEGLEEFLVRTKDQTDQSGWQEELLMITRRQTDEWLDKVYGSETNKNQSSDGKLSTSLCEDVFYFFRIQLRTFCELLSENSDALVLAVVVILSHMRTKQVHARDDLLLDLETCCAASNDFTRMSEKCEDMISELISQHEFSEESVATLEASSDTLMSVYSSDAVYAARSVHIHVFKPIEDSKIGIRLFEKDWEETLSNNELVNCLVQTLEDFREDLERYMDPFMSVKSMISLMSATVIFYIKCLLLRAERHRKDGDGEKPFFGDVKRALDRMSGDIQVIKDYFEGLVPKMPPLRKNVEKDFEILDTIHELMSVAAGYSVSDAEDFILLLQKRVRDVGITKLIVGDLWHLVARTERRNVWKIVKSMEEQLTLIASVDDNFALEVNDRSYVKGLRLDEMAMTIYNVNRQNKPASVYRSLSNEYRMRIKPQISASKTQISASTSHLNGLGLTGFRKMRSEWQVSKEKLQKMVRD